MRDLTEGERSWLSAVGTIAGFGVLMCGYFFPPLLWVGLFILLATGFVTFVF